MISNMCYNKIINKNYFSNILLEVNVEITEVKQSKTKENVEYINPKELKDKKQVYSQAHFTRIKTGDNEYKLTLKIGRYKKMKFLNLDMKTDNPESNNPKSELTLDNDELNSLVEYINDNYYPLSNNESKYLSLDNETISTLVKESPKSITKLISVAIENDLDLSDINKIIEISDRKKALCQFAENYKNDVEEKVWQKWFEDNNWVLGTDFVRISDDRRIDIKNISDFIAENLDGFIDVIEIKKAGESKQFFEKREDHENLVPSLDLVKALTQLTNYITSLEKKSNDIDVTNRLGKILKPRGILIYGNSKNWKDKEYEAYRLLNSSLNNITVYTYNMVYKRAIKMNEYLSSMDKKEEHND